MTNNIHRDTIDRALGYTSSNKVEKFNSCKLTSHPKVPPLMRDVLYLTAVLNRSCTFLDALASLAFKLSLTK